MLDDLPAITAFVRTAEAGSLTEAARRLGITTSGIGKAVTRLECQLGVRLLNRSARRVALTPEGETYFQRCRDALSTLEDARSDLLAFQKEPQGRLAVEVPVLLGRAVVMPLVPRFLARWPRIELRLVLNDGRTDFAADGVDCVIRTGALEDSALLSRRLAEARWLVCGSPAWFAERGRPQRPEDLVPESCLPDFDRGTGRPKPWRFQAGSRTVLVQPRGRLVSNSCEALVAAAAAGLGLVQTPAFFARDALALELVEPVLDAFQPEPYPVSLVYPPSRRLSATVRAFADFMAEELPPRL